MVKRKPKTKKPKLLADALRDAILESGLTHYRIGKNAGIGADQVDRFMLGRDVRISTAGKIIEALGMTIQLTPKGADQ